MTENTSYLDAEFGVIRVLDSPPTTKTLNASTPSSAARQTGFIVPFQMPTTSLVQVSLELICLLCRHHISTSDEWGWSDFYCRTQSRIVVAAYWHRDDELARSEPIAES